MKRDAHKRTMSSPLLLAVAALFTMGNHCEQPTLNVMNQYIRLSGPSGSSDRLTISGILFQVGHYNMSFQSCPLAVCSPPQVYPATGFATNVLEIYDSLGAVQARFQAFDADGDKRAEKIQMIFPTLDAPYFITNCPTCPTVHDGHYLEQGGAEDIGLRLATDGVLTGDFLFFAPGAALPSTRFVISTGSWGANDTFTATAVDVANASHVATLSGQFHSPDTMDVDYTIDGVPGSASLTAREPIDYDVYKCWQGAGSCPVVLGPPTCTITGTAGDDTTVTFDLIGSVPFKAADGNLVPGTALFGELDGEGSNRDATGPIDDTFTDGGATITTVVNGVASGTVDYDVSDWVGAVQNYATRFQVSNATNTSNEVRCGAAVFGQHESFAVETSDGGSPTSVSVDGSTMVAGAIDDATFASRNGAAYVFTESGGTWTQSQKLFANDPTERANFGQAVGIGGDTLVVGAPGASGGGAVYLFTRSGGAFSLTGRISVAGGDSNDQFGETVDVDASGSTFIVGDSQNDDLGNSAGAVYVWELLPGGWGQTAVLHASDGSSSDDFGRAAAVSGSTIVVGAFNDSPGGSAYVFEKVGGVWQQTQKLTGSDTNFADKFATALDLEGDTLVVGAWGAENPANGHSEMGKAYIFERTGSTFGQTRILLPGDITDGSQFGLEVAALPDRVLVGAPSRVGPPVAYLYGRDGGGWSFETKLYGTNATAWQGFAQSLELDGTSAYSVAHVDDGLPSEHGAVYGFALP
ncbi:MAG: hypothetical protein U0610_27370 [bacterium]